MAPDEYVRQVLAKYWSTTATLAWVLKPELESKVAAWAGSYLRGFTISGSNAKGTTVSGLTDVDYFISLSATTPGTLKDNFLSLHAYAEAQGWSPRAQNVSIGIDYAGYKVDLVPGRVQTGYVNYHSLYRRKTDSWTQTNVAEHIRLVRESGRTEEIRGAKIWRSLHGLEFPSFYLELATLEAVRHRRLGAIADNIWALLEFLAGEFPRVRLVDPANTNNVVSDSLTAAQKDQIAAQARRSLSATDWSQVLW
jgi:hypothetical protein